MARKRVVTIRWDNPIKHKKYKRETWDNHNPNTGLTRRYYHAYKIGRLYLCFSGKTGFTIFDAEGYSIGIMQEYTVPVEKIFDGVAELDRFFDWTQQPLLSDEEKTEKVYQLIVLYRVLFDTEYDYSVFGLKFNRMMCNHVAAIKESYNRP